MTNSYPRHGAIAFSALPNPVGGGGGGGGYAMDSCILGITPSELWQHPKKYGLWPRPSIMVTPSELWPHPSNVWPHPLNYGHTPQLWPHHYLLTLTIQLHARFHSSDLEFGTRSINSVGLVNQETETKQV
jgi:hypothetical protein